MTVRSHDALHTWPGRPSATGVPSLADAGPRALIVDAGDGRGALAAARTLARGGWIVGLASPVAAPLLAHSRAIRGVHPVPWPTAPRKQVRAALEAAIRSFGYEVVFGGGDDWVVTLAELVDGLPCRVAHAPAVAVRDAQDKLALTAHVRAAGLTPVPTEPATPARLASWSGPMVIKTRSHLLPGSPDPSRRIEALRTADRSAARARIELIECAGADAVLQPVVDGRLAAIAGLRWQGRWLQVCAQLTPGTWPTPMGSTSRSSTVTPPPRLTAGVGALVDRLGVDGVVEVEFLRGPDGDRVIDVNTRFYGGMALADAAGLTLADTWGRLLTGELDPGDVIPTVARAGQRFHWLEGELRRAVTGRWSVRPGAVAAAVLGSPGGAHPVGDPRDPGPAIATARSLAQRAGRRMRGAVVA